MIQTAIFPSWRSGWSVGHKRDGRSLYDEKAKHELILACRELGASVAKIARGFGVNVNQVASWVRQYERSMAQSTPPGGEIVDAQVSAFVPVRIEPAEQAAPETVVNLQARLRPRPGTQRDRGLGEGAVSRFDQGLKVHLHRPAVDFRMGINGLALLVEQSLGLNPFPSTAGGCNTAPCVAAKLDVAQQSDVTKVVRPDILERPIYAGNAIATVQSTDAVKAIIVRITGFDAAASTDSSPAVETVATMGDSSK